MPDEEHGVQNPRELRQKALSAWDNEGGASPHGHQVRSNSENAEPIGVPQLTNTELVQMRVRVIALENLVIALLAESGDRQIELAREMAAYVSPRPGFTHHPLTIHAAAQMIDLVERAGQFRCASDDERSDDAQIDG